MIRRDQATAAKDGARHWLENAVRLEPRAIELPRDADAVALPVIIPTRRQLKRSGDPKGSPEKWIPQLQKQKPGIAAGNR